MEFLELVESINSDAASANKIFQGDGVGVHSLRHDTPQYKKGLAEAANLVAHMLKTGSRLDMYRFQEALTTSDFPIYFGDLIDRQVLANYAEAPQTYTQWAKVSEVADFRPAKRYWMDGGEGQLKPVDELGEYKSVGRTEGQLSFTVKKFGARFDISWEAVLNDDLNLLTDQPARFGKAARRTEEKEATKLLFTKDFFSSTNDNEIDSNPLTVQNLQKAIDKFASRVDTDGEPIMVGPAILMVPPALEVTARNILNATEFLTWDGGQESFQMRTNNWMSQRLRLVVNNYLPILDPTAGNKTYYLLADPSDARGAVEFAFLRGHRNPEVFMKSPNALAVGGASAGSMAGDFEHDAIGYKVRHVMGGTVIDPKCALKSVG